MSYSPSLTTVETRGANRVDAPATAAARDTDADVQRRRMVLLPISRLYLTGLVVRIAEVLTPTKVRPWQVTLVSASLSAAAAALLVMLPGAHVVVAVLVWAAWLCDLVDGALARRQGTTSDWGGWLDANIDEAADVAMHVAAATAAAALWPAYTSWFWALLVTFVAAKFLLMHGLWSEPNLASSQNNGAPPQADTTTAKPGNVLKRLYHFPGNTDVRTHLLIGALLTGWLPAELALVAAYYLMRVVVRYPLVFARLRGGAA